MPRAVPSVTMIAPTAVTQPGRVTPAATNAAGTAPASTTNNVSMITAHCGKIAGPRPDSIGFSGGLLLSVPVTIGSAKRPVLSIRGIAKGASGGVLFGSIFGFQIVEPFVGVHCDEIGPVFCLGVDSHISTRAPCLL